MPPRTVHHARSSPSRAIAPRTPRMPRFHGHDSRERVPGNTDVRIIVFDTLAEKASWLDAQASLDALRMGIQKAALSFPSDTAENRARAIQRWVRDHIHYQHDYRVTQALPGEEFADSESILKRGYDDCDGKSRLFVALIRAAEMIKPLGLKAEIRPVFKIHPLAFVHVQAVVKWPGSQHVDGADNQGWLIVELILAGCELGQDPDSCPRGPKGERIIR